LAGCGLVVGDAVAWSASRRWVAVCIHSSDGANETRARARGADASVNSSRALDTRCVTIEVIVGGAGHTLSADTICAGSGRSANLEADWASGLILAATGVGKHTVGASAADAVACKGGRSDLDLADLAHGNSNAGGVLASVGLEVASQTDLADAVGKRGGCDDLQVEMR
jgi:hypothetical protein